MLQKGIILLAANPKIIGQFCEYIGSMPKSEGVTKTAKS